MESILSIYGEIDKQYQNLKKFICNLEENQEYYRDNQEILYTGIISRTYGLWETFNKDIVYEYFKKEKTTLIDSEILIKKLRLNELPGFIVELGSYNRDSDSVQFALKQDFVTYTSKNIDLSQMKELYARVNLDIPQCIYGGDRIKMFFKEPERTFDITEDEATDIRNALKRIIDERNKISHSTLIDQYYSLVDIRNWIEFILIICKEITINICNKDLIKNNQLNKQIGLYNTYFKKNNALAIDIGETIEINKDSLIGLTKNKRLVDIVKAVSFKVDGVEKDKVGFGDKAGIILRSIFQYENSINKTTGIYLLN